MVIIKINLIFFSISSTHRNSKEKSIGIKGPVVELNVEIAVPDGSRRHLNHGVAIRRIAELECIRLVRIAADLRGECGRGFFVMFKKRFTKVGCMLFFLARLLLFI
jgi:hypothetical protein